MPSSMSQIREALAESMLAVDGLRVFDVLPAQPPIPCAIVAPDTVEYDSSFGNVARVAGLTRYEFIITVLVGSMSERAAQHRLDGYVSPSGDQSIKAAVESDRTLGGVVSDVRVAGMRDYVSFPNGDSTFLGAEFVAQVMA